MALSAAVRAVVTAVSGLVLVVGLALLVWAVTPASGSSPVPVLRGGVAAFAAGNLLPVIIGEFVLTLPPLLLTVLFAGLLGAGAVRGRVAPQGLVEETVAALLAAVCYAAVVVLAVVLVGPPGAVRISDSWRVAALALAATIVGTLVRGHAWRMLWRDRVVGWLQVGVRCGAAGACALVTVGAAVLILALALSFGEATALAGVAAPTAGDGFGMALLGLAFLPNAVIAAAGFATGVGFGVGPGTYSPLVVNESELPAVPLLAAVPNSAGVPLPGLLFVLGPLAVGVLMGAAAARRLDTRLDRMLAAILGAVLAGGLMAGLAVVAAGGVQGSVWAHLGVPPGLFAAAVAVELALPALAVAGVAGWSKVPWRRAAADGDTVTSEHDADADESAEAAATGPEVDEATEEAVATGSVDEAAAVEHGDGSAAPTVTAVAVPSRTLDPGRAWLYRRFSVAARAHLLARQSETEADPSD